MSESLLSNPLKFETNPYHNVVMKDRKSLDLTPKSAATLCLTGSTTRR